MYRLVKLFDKSSLMSGEVIQKFYFNNDGLIFAVETDKAIYQLEKI